MESSSINTFNELLYDKAIASGWTNSNADILMIPDSNGNIRNLIREFGRLTVEEVRTHCSTYIRTRTRLVQHDYQMYECLMNSLTESARAKKLPQGPINMRLMAQNVDHYFIDTY